MEAKALTIDDDAIIMTPVHSLPSNDGYGIYLPDTKHFDTPLVRTMTNSPPTSKPRTTTQATTPNSSTSQKRRVQKTKPTTTLMDQLDMLMSTNCETTYDDVVASPSKSPGKKKKPAIVLTETDDATNGSNSEQNDVLSNSERGGNKEPKGTRSRGALPKIPRSPQRKKRVVSTTDKAQIEDAITINTSNDVDSPVLSNCLLDHKYLKSEENKIPLSPKREKRTIKKRTENEPDQKSSKENTFLGSNSMGEASERSTRSSSSTSRMQTRSRSRIRTQTRTRSRSVVTSETANESTDDSELKLESTSERTVKSSSQQRNKEKSMKAMDDSFKNGTETACSEQSSLIEKKSFKMEPILVSTTGSTTAPKEQQSKSPLSKQSTGHKVAVQVVTSAGIESFSSRQDDSVTAPLLLQSCERSESMNFQFLLSTSSVLSDDKVDRLNRSSLSDIEKSGIGVERSIKKAIKNIKQTKMDEEKSGLLTSQSEGPSYKEQSTNDDKTIQLNASDDGGKATNHENVFPNLNNQLSEEGRNDIDFNLSIAQDDGLLIENLQEFIVGNGVINEKTQKQENHVSELDDEYIEEEVMDDDDDDDEVATFNSSMQLSFVAAEMDEAMTKVWANFDDRLNKSAADKNVTSNDTTYSQIPISNQIDPANETAINRTAVVEVIINDSTNTVDAVTDNSLAQNLVEMPTTEDEKSSTNDMDTASLVSSLPIENDSVASVITAVPTTPANKMEQPDDTRLSSLVKLLVVDAWNTDINVVSSCLEEMTNLCETDENAVSEMFQHGGHLVVIVLMRRFSDNANIQIAALLTLQKAAECRNEFTEAIIALGALELIVVTMKNHDTNEDVVTAGCGALLNLTLPAKHAKVFVFELIGIQSISQSASKFPTKLALQKYALWMLQYFSYWEEYKIQIVQQGGMQTLAIMIESFSSMVATDDNNKAAIESILKSASATMKRLL